MHHHRFWHGVLLLGVALVLALPVGVIAEEGATTQAPATPMPVDDRIDIGGRALFLSCTGTGAPTVVLEAGGGNSAETWAGVQPQVTRFTRVCSYDRAGLGQSDPAPAGVRTVQDSVDDLHALLAAAGISDPIVLAGHSLGGLIVRLYASQYPADVVGVVLAAGFHGAAGAPPDPVCEDLWAELQREQARVLDARFIAVPEADHFLQHDRPELVVQAIRQVVEAVRDPDSWVAPTPLRRTTGTPVP